MEGHYRNRRGLAGFVYDLAGDAPVPVLPDKHIIRNDRFTSGKGDVVRLVWAFPDDADSGLRDTERRSHGDATRAGRCRRAAHCPHRAPRRIYADRKLRQADPAP